MTRLAKKLKGLKVETPFWSLSYTHAARSKSVMMHVALCLESAWRHEYHTAAALNSFVVPWRNFFVLLVASRARLLSVVLWRWWWWWWYSHKQKLNSKKLEIQLIVKHEEVGNIHKKEYRRLPPSPMTRVLYRPNRQPNRATMQQNNERWKSRRRK